MPRPVHRRIPYDSHPLYTLRRSTLFAATTGILFHLIVIACIAQSYRGQERLSLFVSSAIILSASVALVSYDLITYAAREAVSLASQASPTAALEAAAPLATEPPWPSYNLLTCDFAMAVVLLWLFYVAAVEIAGNSYYHNFGRSETLEAYANLGSLFAGIGHALAFWRELMARKQSQWRRGLEQTPCENCGHVVESQDRGVVSVVPRDEEADPSRQPLLAGFGKVGKLLPRWAQNTKDRRDGGVETKGGENEAAGDGTTEPLLITPDESTIEAAGPSGQYGSMAQSGESSTSVPETIVTKKEKGKKRVVDVED